MALPYHPSLEAAYLAAVYEVDFSAGSVRFQIGDALEAPPFALITAYNPGVARPSQAENEAANQRLQVAIGAAGWQWLCGRGMKADGSHVEPSFAVFGITLEDAKAVAAGFGQAAIAWFDGRAARLEWIAEANQPLPP